jgi:hypothetical protein
MNAQPTDPVQLLARFNPVTAERLDELAHGLDREATFARILAVRRTFRQTNARRFPRRRLAAAVVLAAALAVPALAFAGVLGSLFGFSNQGTPVGQDALSSITNVLSRTGAAPGKLVQLAGRDGVGVYADRSTTGNLCFYVGPQAQADLKSSGLSGGCTNTNAANFPTPGDPVYDMSLFALAPGAAGPSVQRLAGVAADGVASIQVLALSDCHVVATAPVSGNVYIADNLPLTAEAQIVAIDAAGNPLWHESVTPGGRPTASSCGLG